MVQEKRLVKHSFILNENSMVQKRRLVKHSFWVKKTYYLAQRQNLWECTGTIKNKQIQNDIVWSFKTLPVTMDESCMWAGLPRLTEAYPRIPKLNWLTNKQLMPMQCSPAVSLFKEVSIGNCLQWNSFCVHCSYIFKCQKRLSYSVPESNG